MQMLAVPMLGSKRHRITKQDISPPTNILFSNPPSPTFGLSPPSISADLAQALHYISTKLSAKSLHLTFVAVPTLGKDAPLPPAPSSIAAAIPASPIPAPAQRTLNAALSKATRKFPAAATADLLRPPPQPLPNVNALVHRSLRQGAILFSSEALTLVGVDCIYALKAALVAYAQSRGRGTPPFVRAARLQACVDALRRVRAVYGRRRPLSVGCLMRAYDHLAVRADVVREAHDAYSLAFDDVAVVFGGERGGARRARSAAQSPAKSPVKRLSARDITPITQGEWNAYVAKMW